MVSATEKCALKTQTSLTSHIYTRRGVCTNVIILNDKVYQNKDFNKCSYNSIHF